MPEATTTPSRPQPTSCHGTLWPCDQVVKEVTSALDAMKQQNENIWVNVHRLGVYRWEKKNNILKENAKKKMYSEKLYM